VPVGTTPILPLEPVGDTVHMNVHANARFLSQIVINAGMDLKD
jgi:hypothetical protein